MIEWFKYSEKIPEKESQLLILCGEQLFLGFSKNFDFMYVDSEVKIFFQIRKSYVSMD